jgi:hypothetical protein
MDEFVEELAASIGPQLVGRVLSFLETDEIEYTYSMGINRDSHSRENPFLQNNNDETLYSWLLRHEVILCRWHGVAKTCRECTQCGEGLWSCPQLSSEERPTILRGCLEEDEACVVCRAVLCLDCTSRECVSCGSGRFCPGRCFDENCICTDESLMMATFFLAFFGE